MSKFSELVNGLVRIETQECLIFQTGLFPETRVTDNKQSKDWREEGKGDHTIYHESRSSVYLFHFV